MRSAPLLVVLTVAAWTVGYIRPGYRLGAATTWGLIVLVYGSVWAALQTRALVRRGRSPYDQTLHPPGDSKTPPADLVRCERIFGRRIYSPGDFDHAVRPLLRTLIRHRLSFEHRVTLDDAYAHEVMSPELVGLAGNEPSETLYGRNLATTDIERILNQIETLTAPEGSREPDR